MHGLLMIRTNREIIAHSLQTEEVKLHHSGDDEFEPQYLSGLERSLSGHLVSIQLCNAEKQEK